MKRIAIILVLVFILAWINHTEKMAWVPFNWFSIPNAEELYLVEYPKKISGDMLQFGAYSSKSLPCSVYFCNKTLQKPLDVGQNIIELSMEGCGQEMLTILSCGESEVRFSSVRINRSFAEEHIKAKLDASSSKRTVELNITLNSQLNDEAYRNFEVVVDGATLLRPTYLLQSGSYESHRNEELHLEPGTHKIEFRYGNETLDAKSVSIAGQPFPFPDVADILLSLALAFAIHKMYSLDWLTSSLVFFGLSLSALALQLQLQKNLGLNEWSVPVLLIVALVLLWMSKEKQ